MLVRRAPKTPSVAPLVLADAIEDMPVAQNEAFGRQEFASANSDQLTLAAHDHAADCCEAIDLRTA